MMVSYFTSLSLLGSIQSLVIALCASYDGYYTYIYTYLHMLYYCLFISLVVGGVRLAYAVVSG